MTWLRRSDDPLALVAVVRAHVSVAARQLREVYPRVRLKARRAKVRLRIVLAHYYYRLSDSAALVAFPIRRPFMFLANLFAETGVLLLRLDVLLVRLCKLAAKAEGYFLKLENSRLEVHDDRR